MTQLNEQVEVLRAIYSRPNEIVYDERAERLTYNAFDEQRQRPAFAANVHAHAMITVDSHVLTNDELKQLRAKACATGTLYDLFSTLKDCYDELMARRTKDEWPLQQRTSALLLQIDHMRSVNVYMKHLHQWADQLDISGRVLVIPHGIFIIVEGTSDNLKVRPARR